MAKSTGIILVVGAVTFSNEVVFAPLAASGAFADSQGKVTAPGINWRVIPATLIAAALLGGLEQVSPKLAVGLAYISLITVLFARLGNAPAPVENVAKALGY